LAGLRNVRPMSHPTPDDFTAHRSWPDGEQTWAVEPTGDVMRPPPQDPYTDDPYLLDPHLQAMLRQQGTAAQPAVPAVPQRRQPEPPPFAPQPQPQPPYPGPPYPASVSPAAPQSPPPAGFHPPFGPPLSDKSKTTAGLLQLIPGLLISVGGIGRLYAGHRTLGRWQLASSVVAWLMFACGFATVFPFGIFAAFWVWFIVDGIVLLAGKPVDGQGRPLRA
jgi:hypothetical protein